MTLRSNFIGIPLHHERHEYEVQDFLRQVQEVDGVQGRDNKRFLLQAEILSSLKCLPNLSWIKSRVNRNRIRPRLGAFRSWLAPILDVPGQWAHGNQDEHDRSVERGVWVVWQNPLKSTVKTGSCQAVHRKQADQTFHKHTSIPRPHRYRVDAYTLPRRWCMMTLAVHG